MSIRFMSDQRWPDALFSEDWLTLPELALLRTLDQLRSNR